MSNVLANLKALAAQNAEIADDMNEAVAGGGGKQLPVGPTLARLVQVVELGEQPQEYQGQVKDPAMEIFLGFELYGPGFAEADGTPFLYRSRNIKISRNEKANARKIFLKLNWKKQASTFAELLDEPFLLYFKEVDSKSKPGTKVVVWDTDNILPAIEAISGQPYQVPAGREANYKVFLWDFPTKETWDSLKIEGTYDDGKSRNWIQEKIISAVNFEGSKLHALLGGGASIPTLAAPALPSALAAVAAPAVAAPAPAAPTVPTIPAVPAAPALPVLPTLPAAPIA